MILTQAQIYQEATPPPLPSVSKTDEPISSEIVVTGTRPRGNDIKLNEYSERAIANLNVLTVGELIGIIQRRNGGRPLSIIVNGRRLGSTSDLLQLPPEALSSLQILSPSSANKYGLRPDSRMVNLVLKERFRSVSADAGISTSTQPGFRSADMTLRPARITGESRINGSLSYADSTGLAERDRLSLIDSDDRQFGDRSLTPRSRSVSGTVGWSTLVGSKSLTVSGSIDRRTERQISRVYRSSESGSQIYISPISDLTTNMQGQLSATLSNTSGKIGWSSEFNAASGALSTGSKSLLDRIPAAIQGDSGPTYYPKFTPLDVRANSKSVAIALSANANAIDGPTGDLGMNVRLSTGYARYSTRSGVDGSSDAPVIASRLHIGVDVPIFGEKLHPSMDLGMLNLSVAYDAEKVTGFRLNPSRDATLTWQPLNDISVIAYQSISQTLPAAPALRNPIVVSDGTLIADIQQGVVVPVARISGGNPDLVASRESKTSVAISFTKQVKEIDISLSSEYYTTITRKPLIVTAYPSSAFQELFPGRFIRDEAGQLRTIDVRSFNAWSQEQSAVFLSLHASRTTSGGKIDSAASESSISWDIAISDTIMLGDRLKPGASSDYIDLLRSPLDSGQGTSRHRLNVEGSASRGRLGVKAFGNWRSGLVSQSIASDSFQSWTRPFWTADVEVTWTHIAGNAPQGHRPVRFWFSVSNIFNRRLKVSDADGTIALPYRPIYTDPIGRSVSLRVSKGF